MEQGQCELEEGREEVIGVNEAGNDVAEIDGAEFDGAGTDEAEIDGAGFDGQGLGLIWD